MNVLEHYPNAELIKIIPGEQDLMAGTAFLPSIDAIRSEFPEHKHTPISYFTFNYNGEKAQTEVWVQHPEKPVLGAFDEPAKHLLNNATKYPTTRWNCWWQILTTAFWHKRGKQSKWAMRHAVIGGHSELQLILTFRTFFPRKWHLSVVPCRFGRLFPWEEGELHHAFGMVEPVTKSVTGNMTHYMWNSDISDV